MKTCYKYWLSSQKLQNIMQHQWREAMLVPNDDASDPIPAPAATRAGCPRRSLCPRRGSERHQLLFAHAIEDTNIHCPSPRVHDNLPDCRVSIGSIVQYVEYLPHELFCPCAFCFHLDYEPILLRSVLLNIR